MWRLGISGIRPTHDKPYRCGITETGINGRDRIMFSEAEQRRLAEIEALLRVDDPGFVQRFDARWGAWRKRKILAILAFVMAVTVTIVA
jgi:Protein of unknown function (DUF3040)